jgi:2-polyprenyl-3-methyl-5-hydroxy-6-metoxy-1,4-benzoquinol methylase
MNTALHELGNIATSVSYFQSYNIAYASRLLDIGTHFGSFLQQIYSLGYRELVGVDVELEALMSGLETYSSLCRRLLHYDGKSLPFCDDSFDVVTMFDVIEHVPQSDIYLCEVQRILKPNGLLIFQTPNVITNLPWEIIHQRSFTRWRSYHCSLQTLTSLKKLLGDAGFNDVRIEKHSLVSDYNTERAKRVLGAFGLILLRLATVSPLYFYPNFWGSCRKAAKVVETADWQVS